MRDSLIPEWSCMLGSWGINWAFVKALELEVDGEILVCTEAASLFPPKKCNRAGLPELRNGGLMQLQDLCLIQLTKL